MGVRSLDRPEETQDHSDVASYAEAIALLCRGTRKNIAIVHPIIIPFPRRAPADERHVTVELDHLGDFSDDKNQVAHLLAALDLE
jgi:hypothetical protein